MDKKRVLVVDDESDVRQLLSRTLADEFEVLTARSGEEGIKKAVLEHPQCILVDIMMPQMGGFILCDILKSMKQTKLIPIVVVSGKPQGEAQATAKEMGAVEYVEKPFSSKEISGAIHRAMNTVPANRRKNPRSKMRVPLVVRRKDLSQREFEVISTTEDVSQFGALVQLPLQLPVGEEVEIHQVVLGVHDDTIRTHARVVWNDPADTVAPYRHGLEFLNPPPEWVIKG
jgi:CheY-like chemotaxis protein